MKDDFYFLKPSGNALFCLIRGKTCIQRYGRYSELRPFLLAKQKENFQVYFLVNQNDGSNFRAKENITKIEAVYVDLDGPAVDHVLEHCPHVVLESSPGHYQALWLVDEFPADRQNDFRLYRQVQEALIHKFNADDCKDVTRVLRVPGFLNLKQSTLDRNGGVPFEVSIVEANERPPYTFDQLLDICDIYLPPVDETPTLSLIQGGQALGAVVSLEELLEALKFIPADDYNVWIETGMAIKTWSNSREGFDVWCNWSNTGRRNQDTKFSLDTCLSKWNSFKRSNKTIGSVMRQARVLGYSGIDAPDLAAFVSEETHGEEVREKPSLVFPEHLALSAPGIVHELSTWITENAVQPRPVLSLAAALALVSTLKAHRVRTQSNLRTNLYILSIARSGAGKNHPLSAIEMLLRTMGQDYLLAGRPASDAGLLKTLSSRNGKALINWDEFGLDFQTMASDRAPAHMRNIVRLLMELFTKADGTYIGTERANSDGKNPTQVLEQPSLTILGSTTPSVFYDALSSGAATTGFLPRWLVFETENVRIRKRSLIRRTQPPKSLCIGLQRILDWPTNAHPSGNLDMSIKPRLVPFTEEAARILDNLDEYFMDLADEVEDRFEPICTRGAEIAQRLALTVADYDEISGLDMRWAAEVAKHCVKGLIAAAVERVGDSQYEKDAKFVLRCISSKKSVTRTQLIKSVSRRLKSKDCDIILEMLLTTGQVTARVDAQNKTGKITTLYQAV